ncbi:MAG TPA: hypothetical protein VFV62_08575 [Gaiellaceae bacterium]|nr:hypothetical protein [Gaiellaceae bacterium]
MTTNGHSRRSLIGRGFVGLAAAIGLGAGAGVTAARTSGSGEAAPRTLKLDGRGWTLTTPGRRIGERVQPGDRSAVHGQLLEGDRVVGSFFGSRLAAPSQSGGLDADASLELHTFTLEGGTILGMGSSLPEAGVFAIVGGSGIYANARGSYTAEQQSYELGGNGSASFVLSLTA